MARPPLIRKPPSKRLHTKRLHTGLVGRPPEPDEIQPVTEPTAEIKPESKHGRKPKSVNAALRHVATGKGGKVVD